MIKKETLTKAWENIIFTIIELLTFIMILYTLPNSKETDEAAIEFINLVAKEFGEGKGVSLIIICAFCFGDLADTIGDIIIDIIKWTKNKIKKEE